MKNLFIAILMMPCTTLLADCASGSLSVLPAGKSVAPNTLFILEGYGQEQKIIHELGKAHKIWLETTQQKVYLDVQEICVSSFSLTQAILRPRQPLKAGYVYTLHIDGLARPEHIYHNGGGEEHPAFFVDMEKDETAPVVLGEAVVTGSSVQHYGCGPSEYVSVEMKNTEKNGLLVKVNLKDLQTGEIVSYYISSHAEAFSIGHGMCSGAFSFTQGHEYEATLELMDLCGNKTPYTGAPLRFKAPE
jgi:hypothetical protein